MIIAIDFDGTIVEHKYPDIGNEVSGAFRCMKLLQNMGHLLILYTMRSGKELEEAVQYCKSRGIEFWGINENPDQKKWTDSPKIYAQLYIEDAGFGMPKRLANEMGLRPVVDWEKIERAFLKEDGSYLRNWGLHNAS